MDKKLSIGEEVLRFRKKNYSPEYSLEPYVVGTVLSSRMSHDLSYHGSPWYEEIYEVLGEDGSVYIGNYGSAITHDSYFLRREDYIRYLSYVQKKNRENIQIIRKFNRDIQGVIQQLQSSQKGIQYVHKK